MTGLAPPIWVSPPCGGPRPPPFYPPAGGTPVFVSPANGGCGTPNGHYIVSNNGNTIQGGNVNVAEVAQICGLYSGVYYLEVTFNAGAAADGAGFGFANVVPATPSATWANGIGTVTNASGTVYANTSALGTISTINVGTTVGIVIDTIQRQVYMDQNGFMVDGTTDPIGYPTLNAISTYGFSGSPDISSTAYALTIFFPANTADTFTVNNGSSQAFVYIPPTGIALGWGGAIPNDATYLGFDPATANQCLFGYGNHAISKAGNGQGARTKTGKTSGKWYAEFTLSQWGNNNNWCGIVDSTITFPSGFSAPSMGALVAISAPSGYLGHSFLNTIGQICLDADADLMWIRGKTAANWNNNAMANPATGAHGYDLSGMTPPFYFAGGNDNSNYIGDLTFINNPAYMTYTAPSSFVAGW
jgi:hypothetical protein